MATMAESIYQWIRDDKFTANNVNKQEPKKTVNIIL